MFHIYIFQSKFDNIDFYLDFISLNGYSRASIVTIRIRISLNNGWAQSSSYHLISLSIDLDIFCQIITIVVTVLLLLLWNLCLLLLLLWLLLILCRDCSSQISEESSPLRIWSLILLQGTFSKMILIVAGICCGELLFSIVMLIDKSLLELVQ